MAESIIMCTCTDKANVINKTITNLKTVTANILDGNYRKMHIRFQGTSLSDKFTLDDYNYCYSQSRQQYYFVRYLKAYANGTYECDLEIDVLKTYQTQILNNEYIIERSEKNFSLYLKDNAYTEYAYKKSENIVFPSGFSSDASTIILTTNTI